MYKNKKVFITTGPSLYSPEVKSMIEDYFGGISLFCNQDKKEDLDYIIEQMDALCLIGGNDLFPGTIGNNVTHGDGYSRFDVRRDRREMYLLDKAIKLNKPVLTLCRGTQLLCAKFGFSIIPNLTGDIAHSAGDIKINSEHGEWLHNVTCLPEFKDKYFDEEGSFSAHHQGIYYNNIKEKNGLKVVAVADTDTDDKRNIKIVEIVESEKLKIVGSAAHPEYDYMYGNIPSNKVLERFKEFLG
jgi:putative glutamine amidotransferase